MSAILYLRITSLLPCKGTGAGTDDWACFNKDAPVRCMTLLWCECWGSLQLLGLANQANVVAVNANDNDTDPAPGPSVPAYIRECGPDATSLPMPRAWNVPHCCCSCMRAVQ